MLKFIKRKETEKAWEYTCKECGQKFWIYNPNLFEWDGKNGFVIKCFSCGSHNHLKRKEIKNRKVVIKKSKKETGSN